LPASATRNDPEPSGGRVPASRGSDSARDRALAAARVADETRGTNVHVLDLRDLTPVFDYFVVATGASRRQLHAMADEIEQVMKKEMHDTRLGMEGYEEGRWIVLDYGDVVVHLFDAESREYWALEELWSDSKPVPMPAATTAAPGAQR
jgi:ribosome-associated protein